MGSGFLVLSQIASYAMLSKWEVFDLIEDLNNEGRLLPLEAEELTSRANAAAYNGDYQELRKIEFLLLLKKGPE